MSIAVYFSILVFLMFFLLLQGINRGLEHIRHTNMRGILILSAVGMLGWLLALAVLSGQGFFSHWSLVPPRPFVALGIPMLAIAFFSTRKVFKRMIDGVPKSWPVYLQSFRIFVELILWGLFVEGEIPVQMTFEGYNFDVLSGLLALPVAYFCFTKNQWSEKIAVYYNILGIILVTTIVIIAVLSMPSPLRQFFNEPANTIVAEIPYIWLPGFLVPIAYFLHIVSLRQLLGKKAEA